MNMNTHVIQRHQTTLHVYTSSDTDWANRRRALISKLRDNFVFFTDEEYSILPKIPNKIKLHEALEKERFEEASKLMRESETHLVECFESRTKIFKSCLHIIAAMRRDKEQASKLCKQLLERISNRKNREYLLNMTTVDQFDMGGRKVLARVAAIHIAAYNGNSGVVRLLCQVYGVDANCSTSETLEEEPKKGITALEWAARMGHTDVLKALLDNNADVNVRRPTNGATPLYIAAQEGHPEVVKLLLANSADVNASRTNDGSTPLYIAAQNGHTEAVKLLLDNKADVNASRTNDGSTPLYIAAQKGHTEVVKLLLDNKAGVNASCTDDGSTPLYIAAQKGHTEVVKLLLDNKADVNASRTNDGSTPLHIAAQKGHTEAVKLLLDNKADVNASRTNDGSTPLHIAAQNGHTEAVKLLMDNNADVKAKRRNGDKPVDAARRNHHSDIVQLLK